MRSYLPVFGAAVALIVFVICPAVLALEDPEVATSSAGMLDIEDLATLEYPWGMALLPDGRLLITEKPGRLRIWANGGLSDPVEGVPDVVYHRPGEQGGLLDVALDPDFANNRLVYLSYSEAADEQPPDAEETGDPRQPGLDPADNIVRGGAVARGRFEDGALRSVQVIWRQEPKTVGRGHFGNRIIFDGNEIMFITSGDRMRFDVAQDTENNLGAVVRINPDGSIPRNNPFVNSDDARDDLWTYGNRNILSAAICPATGNFWALEMGPRGGDELNLILRGRNYGWPEVSDGIHYNGEPIPDHSTREDFEKPVHVWTPVISPSGAIFYNGEMFPQWRGSLLAGGLSSRALIRLTFDGERLANEERIDMRRRIRDVLEMPDGSLMLLVDDREGKLLRVTLAENEDN